jgi:hypothetical protein
LAHEFSRCELERVDVSGHRYFVGSATILQVGGGHSPRTLEVTFILPAWFGDRTVPRSAIAQYAEGGIQVAARIVEAGDALSALPEPATSETEPIPEEDLLPQPVWGSRVSEDRAPNADEVEARKSFFRGNRAIWLDDDGERIRALIRHSRPASALAIPMCPRSLRARTCFCVKVRLSASPSTREHLGESALARQ